MRHTLIVTAAALALIGSAGLANARNAGARSAVPFVNGLTPDQAETMVQKQQERQTSANEIDNSSTMDKTSTASTGAPLQLTSDEKAAITRAVSSYSPPAGPSNLSAEIGAKVPQSVKLHAFDAKVKKAVPEASKLDYVKTAHNKILLVDPDSRKVVAMIGSQGETK